MKNDWLNEEMPTRQLPGRPRHKRVREVKSVLWRHLRSRPQFSDPSWQGAWNWAASQANPRPEEIATQYLALVLIEMKKVNALVLPRSLPTQLPNQLMISE